ncbi:MAG: hypothetical protein ACREOS_07755, partial [Candidatus Dormibacteraceae bacterium]
MDTQVVYRQASENELRIKVSGSVVYEGDSPRPFDLAVEIVGVYQSVVPFAPEDLPRLLETHSLP